MKKYVSRIISIMLVLALTTGFFLPVYATEKSTSELEKELSGLNKDLEKTDKEISSISKEISEIRSRIKEVKEELSIAKGEEEVQYAAMKTRIKYMYENGSNNLLEILFSAASLADFLKKADFYASINEYDRAALKKLQDTKENIALQEKKLSKEQESLVELQEELTSKQTALKSQVGKKSKELAAQIEKAKKEAEKAKQELDKEVKPTPPSDNSSNTGHTNPDLNYTATASDIELFAALIECEAGSTNYEGMLAVASVVVNRMNHSRYPNTLRGVIFQSGQFPPAHNGKVDRVLARGVKASCVQVANDALAGKNNVGDCLSFRSASSGHAGTIIGSNVFF